MARTKISPHQLRFLRHLVTHAPKIAFSRFRHGPARPSWSYRFELFLAALRQNARDLALLDAPAQRIAFDAMANANAGVFRAVDREETTFGDTQCMWFVPKKPKQLDTTLFYIHGGGYVFGSMRSHGELISRIALTIPAKVISPDYRLAPEHPFPAAIDDVVAAYRAFVKTTDPKRLLIGGDSAGGGLTMALLQKIKEANDPKEMPLPAGAMLICPWSDLTAEGGSIDNHADYDWTVYTLGRGWLDAYLNGHDAHDPLVSPVYANFEGLPPMLVLIGGAELLHDQSVQLVERAKAAGVDVRCVVEPDMPHDWQSFAGMFTHCRRAFDDVGTFARSVVRIA